jgi:hypothetical protein
MRYKLGRLLQVIGLIMLPMAMAGNLVPNDPLPPGTMLTLTAFGCGVFFLGWWLQQGGKAP